MKPTKAEPPFALTVGDLNSQTWQKLEAFYKKRLHDKRCQNDSPMDEATRNALIGEINECKFLLALDRRNSAPEDAAG